MNILTFDIEEWWAYNYYSIGDAHDYLPRLDRYLKEILDLLDERSIKATFFCLGEVAYHYPQIVKEISQRGHHIGCHSYSHRFLGDLTPIEFARDTKLSLDCIENVIGYKVNSYRAPAFSITSKTIWALEILVENGIEYDSSIFTANRSFGGFSTFQEKTPSIICHNNINIREFPVSPVKFLGKELVFSGGGYFRLFPYPFIKNVTKKSDYVMTYFHIMDFDCNQIKKYGLLPGGSNISRYFKSYYGLKGAYNKFQKYVGDFEFISMKQASDIIDWENVSKVNI